jgi:hypothetical protein
MSKMAAIIIRRISLEAVQIVTFNRHGHKESISILHMWPCPRECKLGAQNPSFPRLVKTLHSLCNAKKWKIRRSTLQP